MKKQSAVQVADPSDAMTFRRVLEVLNNYAKKYPKTLDKPMRVKIQKTPRTHDMESVLSVGIEMAAGTYLTTETSAHRELG